MDREQERMVVDSGDAGVRSNQEIMVISFSIHNPSSLSLFEQQSTVTEQVDELSSSSATCLPRG